MPRICVSLRGGSTGEVALRLRDHEKSSADLLEVRFDYAEARLDPDRLRAASKKPLIATCRLVQEGGAWRGSEEERLRVLVEAAESGFDYVDLEASTSAAQRTADAVASNGSRLVVSHHSGSPLTLGEMEEKLRDAERLHASVAKIIGTARSPLDNAPCMEFLARHPGNVAFAMGPHGALSRVACPLMGGAWTYASHGVDEECAPGQLTLKQIRGIYRAMGVKP